MRFLIIQVSYLFTTVATNTVNAEPARHTRRPHRAVSTRKPVVPTRAPGVIRTTTSVPRATTAPNIGKKGYVTYHPYTSNFPLTSVACSNGANGIMTKFGYTDLSRLYPNVGAASFATWNSPECGGCHKLTNVANGKSLYITVIDQCQPIPGYAGHFDLSPVAFNQLGGAQGLHDGHFIVTYSKVSSRPC